MEKETKLKQDSLGLTRTERLLLRVYFGYGDCKQIKQRDGSFPIKNKESASPAIQHILWTNDENEDNEILDLDLLSKSNTLPQIFSFDGQTFYKMIQEAYHFTTSQQCRIINFFTGIFPKIYEEQLAVQKLAVRILLIGPVGLFFPFKKSRICTNLHSN